VDREEVVEGRLRRYYRLTRAGPEVLAEEAARLHANATAALRWLNPGLAGGVRDDPDHPGPAADLVGELLTAAVLNSLVPVVRARLLEPLPSCLTRAVFSAGTGSNNMRLPWRELPGHESP
jgi:hypothetical protein